jgi:hypothetical protein
MIKLSHNIKAVYFHKLDQYNAFTKYNLPYKESHQRVADILGLSLKVVGEVAIPLLKRMGLIHIEKLSHKNYITTVYPLDRLLGELVNPNLPKHLNKQLQKKKEYKESITYDQLKNIDKNKQKIERMKKDLKEEYFILTKEEMERLLEKRGGSREG